MNRTDAVKKMTRVTVLLPGGIMPREILATVNDLAARFDFGMYFSTAQNLRLINVAEEDIETIKSELAKAGAVFKGPGQFPLPRVCIGAASCNLGITDTIEFSRLIGERFGGRKDVKPKFKIAISGCPAACSGAMLTDIGIVATRNGFDLYVGGKGGPRPKAGRRVKKGLSREGIMDAIEVLVDYHDRKTSKKQRFSKIVDNEDFPFPDTV